MARIPTSHAQEFSLDSTVVHSSWITAVMVPPSNGRSRTSSTSPSWLPATSGIESLIKAGGFDSLGNTRLLMIQVHEDAVEAVVPLKRQQAMGQFDLFGSMGDSDGDGVAASSSSPLAHLKFGDEEYPRKQLLAYEREMLGLYVSAHPLDGAERILRKHAPKPIAAILDDPPKEARW